MPDSREGSRWRKLAAADMLRMVKINRKILAALNPQVLVQAYLAGVFPMVEEGRLYWFSPDERGLLPLDERFHISRRLGRTIRSGRFECTVDKRFDDVVRLCGERGDETGTWISPEMRVAYKQLHNLGLCHSVEAWPSGRIGEGSPVGGIYGVAIGGAFFAESMFHRMTDAGKVALAHLVERLRAGGFKLLDVQWTTENLRKFGAFDVPKSEYLGLLRAAVRVSARF